MLIKRVPSAVNNVYSVSIDVTVDSLEATYMAAYGEPRIDLAGVIPYNGIPTPSSVAPLNITTDIGTVPVAGSVAAQPGVGPKAKLLLGSGTFPSGLITNPGLFHGADDVIGDFQADATLLSATPIPNVSAADGFGVGLAVFEEPGDGQPGLILGWGGHNSGYKVFLWRRSTVGGALTEVAAATLASPTGLRLRIVRSSQNLVCSYSLNGGASYTTLSTVVVAKTAVRVGAFANSGTSQVIQALIDDFAIQILPITSGSSFTIGGSPNLAYIRTNAPHVFSLSATTDPEAEAKVKGWGDTIVARIAAAKGALLANPNPSVSAQTTYTQV